MTDPDLEIRAEVDHSDPKIVGGGKKGWAGLQKKKNLPQFGQKVRRGGGVGPPGPSPGSATEDGR